MTELLLQPVSKKKEKEAYGYVSSTLPGFHYSQELGDSLVWVLFDAKPPKRKPKFIEL